VKTENLVIMYSFICAGIVYLGHLYAGESGEFPPLNWVQCGTVPVSSDPVSSDVQE